MGTPENIQFQPGLLLAELPVEKLLTLTFQRSDLVYDKSKIPTQLQAKFDSYRGSAGLYTEAAELITIAALKKLGATNLTRKYETDGGYVFSTGEYGVNEETLLAASSIRGVVSQLIRDGRGEGLALDELISAAQNMISRW